MEETNTQIAWPSKLKIGAKSKKGKLWEVEKMVVLIAETVEALHICLGENQSLFLSCLSPNICQNAVLGEVDYD